MVNKRKIIVLTVVLFAVIGFSLGAASAASTTVKISKNGANDKIVWSGEKGDVFETFHYKSKKSTTIHVLNVFSDMAPNKKITKVKIFYKSSKGKKISKVYKVSNGKKITKKDPKGYTPYKATIYYKKK